MNKNYTYTFSKGSVLVKSDARIKQDGQVLTIQNLNFLDSGLYSCSFYDENGNKIGGHSFGYFVVSQGIFLLKHLLIAVQLCSLPFRSLYFLIVLSHSILAAKNFKIKLMNVFSIQNSLYSLGVGKNRVQH